MSRVHDLVLGHGREGAKSVLPEEDWHLIDKAAAVLAEESAAIGITYSGFAMTGLPHRKIPDEERWIRTSAGGKFEMVIEPGDLRVNKRLVRFGVPYGSRARLIMIYMQTESIRTNSREVELGRSMGAWMARMGIPDGGKGYEAVREQQNRISACRLAFYWDEQGGGRGFDKDSIVKSGTVHLKSTGDDRQGSLWEERVTLGETFFKALKDHSVPIWEPAIRMIANESMSIDVYIWLAYRLRALSKPTSITWLSLHGQFGAGYKNVFHFKPRFIAALKSAMSVYEAARVDVDADGLVLYPSRPPIPDSKVKLVR